LLTTTVWSQSAAGLHERAAQQSPEDQAEEVVNAADDLLSEFDKPTKNPAARLPAAPLTKDEIEEYGWTANMQTASAQPLESWFRAIQKQLPVKTPHATAVSLARGSGLSAPDMETLIRLWVRAQTRDSRRPIRGGNQALRRAFLDLLERTRRSQLVLQVAADALNGLESCRPEDFDQLMRSSAQPAADAFTIATANGCSEDYAKAAALDPERKMAALVRIVDGGEINPQAAIPLYEWLTGSSALERVAPVDRDAVATWLFKDYVGQLFDVGLNDEAVRVIETLPAEIRQRLLSYRPHKFTAVIDGVKLPIDDSDAATWQQELTAAYALSGRTSEARELLSSDPGLAEARTKFHCDWDADAEKDPACKDSRSQAPLDLLVIDHFLNHADDDAYPLAEVMFATSNSTPSASGATAELRCKVFNESQFAGICRQARWSVTYNISDRLAAWGSDAKAKRTETELARIVPDFIARRDETARILQRRATELGQVESRRSTSESVPAPQSPFVEIPVAKALRAPLAKQTAWPKNVAPLPDGFEPVRFERLGSRAAAVSLSSAYDPTGEVSSGGYWVHLSDDAGKHWSQTYYTGLSQYFPYVVKPSSRVPLIAGDALDVEVEVKEIDTASISYPPVGLVTRRRASGLYLRIPIADLARDSDGDGFTDITEKHLLLDHAQGQSTPFIVGTDPARGCGPVPPEKLALIGLLGQVLSVQAKAIVEPVDRPAGVAFGGWKQGTDPGTTAPIFLSGDPKDFFCLEPNRLMIVYSGKDEEALERFTPDFHTLELPPIVFNRAHDRGYVKWSLGWTGGTLRLRLVNGKWVFEEISHWIT